MESYHPLEAPDPQEWLALSESERILLVEDYHRRSPTRLPNARAHAAFHAVVETQVAMGDEIPVADTLERLQAEGLDRHEALHAIGSVLARRLQERVDQYEVHDDPDEDYWAALRALNARAWKRAR